MGEDAAAERDAPRNIASVRPISWMIGAPSMPPAADSSASTTALARQCTRHRPDRPIAIRSSREVESDSWDMSQPI